VELSLDGAARVSRRPVVVGVVVGYAVLLVLAAGVRTGFPPQLRLDEALSRALYAGDDRSAALNALLQVLTTPGYTWFRLLVFCPVVVWLALRRAWWTAAWVLTAIVLVGPLTTLAKVVVGRLRPQFAGGGAQLQSLSFPSGHASGVATLVTVGLLLAWPVLGVTARRIGLVAGAALVAVVGLSRMWLGVHFLSDVLGGWAFGVAWSLTVALVVGALPGGRAALPPGAPAARVGPVGGTGPDARS
jgi:undecaprenyl-diphosphatase